MKKGFTLIELLIVMVVVSILVTLALPAYKTAMEKGRALEGIANAAEVSAAANAFYVRNMNSYGTQDRLVGFVLGDGGTAGITQSKFFDAPEISVQSGSAVVTMKRKTGVYSISFTNTNGAISSRLCTSDGSATGKRYCNAVGLAQPAESEE